MPHPFAGNNLSKTKKMRTILKPYLYNQRNSLASKIKYFAICDYLFIHILPRSYQPKGDYGCHSKCASLGYPHWRTLSGPPVRFSVKKTLHRCPLSVPPNKRTKRRPLFPADQRRYAIALLLAHAPNHHPFAPVHGTIPERRPCSFTPPPGTRKPPPLGARSCCSSHCPSAAGHRRRSSTARLSLGRPPRARPVLLAVARPPVRRLCSGHYYKKKRFTATFFKHL